jgi:NAD(P)-dependent dehydrogenase (short-subunit alcohol dehydrogenase family)
MHFEVKKGIERVQVCKTMTNNNGFTIPIVPLMATAAAVLVLATTTVTANHLVEAFTKSPISDRTQQRKQASTGALSPIIYSRITDGNGRAALDSSNDPLEGGNADDIFPPKFLEGVLFNLFGIGRKDDEEPNGAFQPPKDSMTGTVVVITGSSAGLGLETAKRLALAGATVVATARTTEKASLAVQAIRDYCRGVPNPNNIRERKGSFHNPNPLVRGIALDLYDLSSVRSFPDRYKDSMLSLSKIRDREDEVGRVPPKTATKKIDVLINNAAGGTMISRTLTIDGFEQLFQSCHLGHFVLTARLFQEGLLNDNDDKNENESDEANTSSEGGSGCTVINVSSLAHRSAEIYCGQGGNPSNSQPTFGFDFANINSDLDHSFDAYARGKLANVMFTKELQKRADLATESSSSNSGSGKKKKGWLTAVSLEPGGVTTDIWRTTLGYDPRTFEMRRANGESLQQPADRTWKDKLKANIVLRGMTQVERGSNAHVWLAYISTCNSNVDLIGGQHYDEYRNPNPGSKFAYNQDLNQKLWEVSEELADIEFDLEASPVPVDRASNTNA